MISVFKIGNPKKIQNVILDSFCDGLSYNNIKHKVIQLNNKSIRSNDAKKYIKNSDGIVLFGYKKQGSTGRLRQQIIESYNCKESTFIVERGYIKRDKYWSVGIGGLNGSADFKNSNSDGDRWELLDTPLLETNWEKNKLVLVCGQVLGDASLIGVNYQAWVYRTIKYIMDYGAGVGGRGYDIEIGFRYHPCYKHKDKNPIPVPNAKKIVLDNKESLTDLLKKCRYTVSFNSNIGVESILNGIPTISCDEKSMVWNISSHDPGKPYMPPLEERKQWAFNLAYSQWTLDEISLGLPQKHLGI